MANDIDDEMESMLREIESMGMAPEAPKEEPVAEKAEEVDLDSALEGLDEPAEDVQDAIAAELDLKEPVPAPVPEKVVEPVKAAEPVKVVEKAAVAELDELDAVVESVVEEVVNDYTPPAPEPEPETRAARREEGMKVAPKKSPFMDYEVDPDKLKEDFSINPTDLDSNMIEHPSLELHYALKTAAARRNYEGKKSRLEAVEADLDAKIRHDAADEGKKLTEASIRSAIVASKEYKVAVATLIDAQHKWKITEACENSMRSRKDMLLEMARDRRKETVGGLRVMEESAGSLRERVAGIVKKD